MIEKKHIAFIGSTVVDVIIDLPHLPKSTEDVNVLQQHLSLGGCAFNASWMCHLFAVPYLLFSPVGKGIYADYIRTQMKEKGLEPSLLQTEEENGCCYCLVEQSGERSFVSYHGAEYTFQEPWFSLLDEYPISTVYLCGLEIEEASGDYIIDYLERHPNLEIYFAPGPRIQHIQLKKMQRILACSPILHVNEEEACSFTHCHSLEDAALKLHAMSKQSLIITLGERGSYVYDQGKGTLLPSKKAQQVDTIGAGDAHVGTIIACRQQGDTLLEAVTKANHIAHEVVQKKGAILDVEEFAHVVF